MGSLKVTLKRKLYLIISGTIFVIAFLFLVLIISDFILTRSERIEIAESRYGNLLVPRRFHSQVTFPITIRADCSNWGNIKIFHIFKNNRKLEKEISLTGETKLQKGSQFLVNVSIRLTNLKAIHYPLTIEVIRKGLIISFKTTFTRQIKIIEARKAGMASLKKILSQKIPFSISYFDNLARGNLDSDDKDEFVAGTNDLLVVAFDDNGKILWAFNRASFANQADLEIGDVSGNDDNEVICGDYGSIVSQEYQGNGMLYCLDNKGNELWRYNINAPVHGLSLADIDRDGKKEIFVGDCGCYITCLKGNGKLIYKVNLYGWYREVGRHSSIDFLQSGDLNFDGKIDLIWSAWHGGITNFKDLPDNSVDITLVTNLLPVARTLTKNNVIWELPFKRTRFFDVQDMKLAQLDRDKKRELVVIASGNVSAFDDNGDNLWTHVITSLKYKPGDQKFVLAHHLAVKDISKRYPGDEIVVTGDKGMQILNADGELISLSNIVSKVAVIDNQNRIVTLRLVSGLKGEQSWNFEAYKLEE